MKEISLKQVEELARLARLGLTEQEKASLAKEMTVILNYVQILDEVSTKNIQPTNQVTGLNSVLRKDEKTVSDILLKERLANVPATENTFIKVKKVLE